MKLNISESIRHLRREADMTQEAVANALGVTYQAVSRWENGQAYPDIELLPSIAALFGVDMDRLFGIDEENMDAQIEKYQREEEALESTEDRIAHVKSYIDAFPAEVYFKMSLIARYYSMGMAYTDKRLPEIRRLCQYVVDHTQPDDWQRTNALCNMIRMEDDENVGKWLLLLDRKSEINSRTALIQRYKYRDEQEKFNRLIQEDIYYSFHRCFMHDFCSKDSENYKVARSRMEGQRVILRIMDVLRDPSTDADAWISDRLFAYVRLAGGCFGCAEIEAGYEALDRCVALCEVCSQLPKESKLTFNSPVLDKLEFDCPEAGAIRYNVIEPLTREEGWEWLNCVRNDERYRQIVARVTRIYEEMRQREA